MRAYNVITGTSHFVSRDKAIEYYGYEGGTYRALGIAVDRKVAEGLIHIGKPSLKPGQRLIVIDDGARYAIET